MMTIEDSGIYSTAVGEVGGLKIIMNLPKEAYEEYGELKENEAEENKPDERGTLTVVYKKTPLRHCKA